MYIIRRPTNLLVKKLGAVYKNGNWVIEKKETELKKLVEQDLGSSLKYLIDRGILYDVSNAKDGSKNRADNKDNSQ